MIGSMFHLLRLSRASFVLAREGVFKSVDPGLAPPAARPLLAVARLMARHDARDGSTRLVAAFARLGPSYVKLGQFLATRPDVVGAKASRVLEQLQDRMPPFPRDVAVHIVETAFGQKLGEVFTEPSSCEVSFRKLGLKRFSRRSVSDDHL